MAVAFFDLKRETSQIRAEIDLAVKSVIDGCAFILGPAVAAFEKEIAEYVGVKHAVGVASGTDALLLSLKAAGIKPGDEVITTPFTFISTAEVIAYLGAVPVFIDIDPRTFNLDPNKIEEKITKKTKAIIPVHLFGNPAEMNPIMSLAAKYKLKIIEDCAQAIGAKYNGKMVGSIGDFGAFSFFPSKNLGGFGDGGIITTNNEDFAKELKVLRNHGSRAVYHHNVIGYNSRLDEIQAAILSVKLRHLDGWAKNRINNAKLYSENIKTVLLPVITPNSLSVYNQFTILCSNRDQLQSKLDTLKIGSKIYYPLSLHLQEAFSSLGYHAGSLPVAEAVQQQVLSLPIFPELTPAEILEVCNAVNTYGKS